VEIALKVFFLVLIFSQQAMQEDFHIWFERTGGFAGMVTAVEIESKSLSDEEAEKIRQLIDQSRFFEVINPDSLSEGAPDQFHYKLKVEYEGKSRSLELKDSNMPDQFHPLIRYLIQKARSK